MRFAPLALLALAPACALPPNYGIQPNRPVGQIAAKPFSASLAFDPPSFELHGTCGRGMTGPSRRPFPGGRDRRRRNLDPFAVGRRRPVREGHRPHRQLRPSATTALPRPPFTRSPAYTGNYEFRATFAATNLHPETIAGPQLYVVPLDVGLDCQAGGAPGSLKASATASANTGAPTTFAYSFCVRSADGSANDAWGPPLMANAMWETTPASPGPWLVYVSVFATQAGFPYRPTTYAGSRSADGALSLAREGLKPLRASGVGVVAELVCAIDEQLQPHVHKRCGRRWGVRGVRPR